MRPLLECRTTVVFWGEIMIRNSGWIRGLCFAWTALIAIGLSGCERAPTVVKASVNFHNARGIQPGAAVTLNGVAIGKVAAVEPAEGGAMVRLDLDAAQAGSVQQGAKASIVSASGQTLVALNNPPQPAAPIADGAVLEALEPGKGLGELIEDVVGAVKDTLAQAKEYFSATNQQWMSAKTEMQKSLQSIAEQSKSVGRQLQQDLDRLLQDMESQARSAGAAAGANVERIKAEYAALDANLAKKAQELQSAGKAETASEVEELRARIKAEVDRFGAPSSL